MFPTIISLFLFRSTAQTLTCITRMKKVVQRLLHVDVLEEFGGITNKGLPNLESWDRLLGEEVSALV